MQPTADFQGITHRVDQPLSVVLIEQNGGIINAYQL